MPPVAITRSIKARGTVACHAARRSIVEQLGCGSSSHAIDAQFRHGTTCTGRFGRLPKPSLPLPLFSPVSYNADRHEA
jgi:hypothetical protein